MISQIPENSQDGNYTLRVEGLHRDEGRYGFIFENETVLLFHPKRVSVFIQTDKAVYQKRETGTVKLDTPLSSGEWQNHELIKCYKSYLNAHFYDRYFSG